MRFLPGLELCRRFHDAVVAPILAEHLPGLAYAAARLDTGSELLGFPTRFAGSEDANLGVAAAHGDRPGVTVAVIDEWFAERLGFDPRAAITAFDWLAVPTQRLAEVTGGAVFHDGLGGEVAAARARLRWYPHDVWRYVLACQWTRVAQDEHLVGAVPRWATSWVAGCSPDGWSAT